MTPDFTFSAVLNTYLITSISHKTVFYLFHSSIVCKRYVKDGGKELQLNVAVTNQARLT